MMIDIMTTGIYKKFPSIQSYLKSYKLGPVSTEEEALTRLRRYANSGAFTYKNSQESPEQTFGLIKAWVDFGGIANARKYHAIKKALCDHTDWNGIWIESVGYEYWSQRLHSRVQLKIHSDFQCGRRPQPYSSMFLLQLGVTVSDCLALGWIERAIDLVHKANWALDNDQFADGGNEAHRRTQHFVLRLVTDWQGMRPRSGPACAMDEPIFNAIIENWRTPDLDKLSPLLLAACDRHTHQARANNDEEYFDLPYTFMSYHPFEIMAVFKVRQLSGLPNPTLDHPLMNTPLGKLPKAAPPYSDELIDGVVARLRQEYPDL